MNTTPMSKINAFSSATKRYLNDEGGVTSIEYALIAGATGLALAAVMPAVKTNLTTIFTAVSNNLQ